MSSDAPGRPGIPPTWTSSAKDAVGSAIGRSRVWFTIGHGIANEVYYPRIDIPQIRDLGFLVADGRGFWSEVKRDAQHDVQTVSPGVPAVSVVHSHPRYRLSLRIAPDPRRDVLAIEVRLDGDADLQPYVLLAPHLGATGHNNRAAVAAYRGRRVLWAEQGPFGLALAAVDAGQSDGLGQASAGYVGASDGWQDFSRHGQLTWHYESAGPGNVALVGALPRTAVLALGFGTSQEAAATLAISSLLQPFEDVWQRHVALWHGWHEARGGPQDRWGEIAPALHDELLTSAMVLRTHLDKTYPGAMVASLSIPWGDTGNERGGYHLVWPRDLVSCAGALLAHGATDEVRETLQYLIATQTEEGHWNQNQWLGGKPMWVGVQLDEAAFPVLLAAALADKGALDGVPVTDMIRRALRFIARHGPTTEQDRWEENAGISPYTLAVTIAALVEGAKLLPAPENTLVLALADFWNASIEHWTAVRDTPLARQLGVKGYYVRGAPVDVLWGGSDVLRRVVPIKNRWPDPELPADEQVSIDFLQLVRYGLRSADDRLVRDSIEVADHFLKVDTPLGPVWRRYRGDGYGEHDDGASFDGTGRGRGWPLLTGERGHFEVAAGCDALPHLTAMARMAGATGLIPEQVWDSTDIPARGLQLGRPTGAAMPLAWAHAEFAKLALSRHLGYPVDRPSATWQRYAGQRPTARVAFWTPWAPISVIEQGQRLAVALPRPAMVHWGIDGWQQVADANTTNAGLDLHVATLDVEQLRSGQRVDFTYQWSDSGDWVGADMRVSVDLGATE